jgi:two-component system, OmpR family, sensor histidine kinase BaeS
VAWGINLPSERLANGFRPIKATRLAWQYGVVFGLMILVTSLVGIFATVFAVDQELQQLKKDKHELIQKILQDDRNWKPKTNDIASNLLFIPLAIPVVLSIFIAVTSATFLVRPLVRISNAAENVARGDLTARVKLNAREERSDAEVFILAKNFNLMAASLEKELQDNIEESAAIAHELRTPLTVLRGRLEGIRYGLFELDDTEIDLLEGQIDVLVQVADDLKILSMAGAGRLKLEPETVDLNKILAGVVMGFQALAQEKNIHLEIRNSPVIEVNVDAKRMNQVFANLISNAIRNTPENGLVQISLSKNTTHATVCIQDTGVGIPTESLERIFEKFYRLDDSRSRERGGSGLGLSIAKTIIELHRGSIQASNRAPSGAEFKVTLPSA